MIKINFYCIGNLKEKYLRENFEEFSKRLSKFAQIKVFEFKEKQIIETDNKELVNNFLEDEDRVILEKIKKDDYVILLDLHGKSLSSEEFAKKINDVISSLRGEISFVIGGTLGVSNSLRNRADFKLKLSDMTFTHQFTRIILIEQIYRAFKINNNESYHH